MEKRLLIVKNIPSGCTRETLVNYLKVVCDNGVEDVDFYDERARHIALVTFTEPLIDVESLKETVAGRKLEGEQLKLRAVNDSQGVIVTCLPDKITEDMLQEYLEHRKSGGEDDAVDDCKLYANLRCAVVTFTSPKIARNVLAVKTHTPVENQPPVKLEPFYKGYQDIVIKFLNDLNSRDSSEDELYQVGASRGCNQPRPSPHVQPTENVKVQSRKSFGTAGYVDLRMKTHSIGSSPFEGDMTSVEVPEVFPLNIPAKKNKRGLITIKVKEKKRSDDNESSDVDAVEMLDTNHKNPTAAKRSTMNFPSEPSEERESQIIKFDTAHVKLLEKMHLVKDEISSCTIKYNSSTGMITIAGPKSKLPKLSLKLYEADHKITKESCHLHQAAIDLISRDKGKRFVEDELKEVKESIWFVEGQTIVCLTFSETETRTMIAKVKSLVHHETVPYNESHFKYINGTQWKDLVQKLEQEHLVKILVDRSNTKVKVECLGKDTAQCRDMIQRELKAHSHEAGEFHAEGALARCLKGSFDKEIKEVKRIIIDGEPGRFWDDHGGKDSLHLKFDGDPKSVKKVEAEMKKLKNQVWHEKLYLRDVSAEKHVNLLIRGIHRNTMSGYQASFESQHSVYLEMNLPKAPKNPEQLERKHGMADNDDARQKEEFSGFKPSSRRSYGPPRRSSPPRQQKTTFTCGNVTLSVKKGDVSKETVDVFVNVVSKNLDLKGTAISKAYLSTGGDEFQQQFDSCKPMWKAGSILQTKCTGNLNGKMVYTFVLDKWNPPGSKKELSSLIDTCLKTAEGNGYTSIALTSFGCGLLFKFPEKYVASCLVKAIKANSDGNLQDVSIVLYDQGTYQAFLDQINSPSTIRHLSDEDNGVENDDDEEEIFRGLKAPSRRSYGPPRRSSPVREQNTSLTCGNVTLTVKKGDVSKEKVDVFVNVVSSKLDLKGTAISKAYLATGGEEFQQQFDSCKPMWKPGSILQTKCTGNLNGKMVYTFVLDKWNPPGSKKELSSLIDTCLKTAEGNGYTSIALTSFGCGLLFKFPEKYVASCLVKAVKANSDGNLQDVSIVLYDQATYQAFLDEINIPFAVRHSKRRPDVDPHPSNDTITVGSTRITVKQGDITTAKGTVMVNVVTEDLTFGVTAVAQALARAGGSQLVQEFEKEKASPSGNIIVTTGGQLNCKFVYHVILKKWNARGPNDYKSRIRECFKLAARYNTKSMVFPAIGCGMLFKYPDDVVASTLIEEAKRSNIPSVTFMIFDQKTVNTFLQELGEDNSDEDEEDTSENVETLRIFAESTRADKVPKADNKSANIVVYGASKDICTKARSELSKQLSEDFLYQEVITHGNLLHFKGKTLSKMKNMADRNGIWIKCPDPDKKRKTDTPTLKLLGEKKAVLQVKSEIMALLLNVSKTTSKPRKPQGAPGSMELIGEMAKMTEFQPPSYWKNKHSNTVLENAEESSIQPSSSSLVPVDQATFNAIDKLIQTTWKATLVGIGNDAVNLHHKKIKVTQIERFEDRDNFRQYSQKRSEKFRSALNQGGPFTPIESLPNSKNAVRTTQIASSELQREIYPEVNEHYLFHGTKVEKLQAILAQGLDPRLGDGMLGKGVYVAESSTKADQYTDDKGNRAPADTKLKMLLVRVLLGQPHVIGTAKVYHRPPCKDGSHDLHDSVIADGVWIFREFVVYEKCVSYPEYVITYKRE